MLPLTLSITLAILRDLSSLLLAMGEPELALEETLERMLLAFLLGDLIAKVASLDVVLEGVIDLTFSVNGRRAGVVEVEVEAIDADEAMDALDEANSCAIFKREVEIAESPATEPGGGINEVPGLMESTDSDLLRFFSFFNKRVSSRPSEVLTLNGKACAFRPSPIPADEQRRPSLVLFLPLPDAASAECSTLFFPSRDFMIEANAESSRASSELRRRLERFLTNLLPKVESLSSTNESLVSRPVRGPAERDRWRNW